MTARARLARWLALAARLVFALLIVILPFRARVDVLPHPASSVPAVLSDIVIYAVDVLVLATLGLWLLARALDRRPIDPGPRLLRLPVLVLVGLAWVTIPFGIEPAVSVAGAIRLTLGAVLALYVLNEVEGLGSVALPLGLMLGLQAAVAIGQAATGGPVGLPWLGELALDPAAAGTSVVTTDDGSRILRSYGLSTHPNVLGGILACGLVLLMGAATGARTSRGARLAQGGVVALAAAALLATFSRGAWLGGLAGLVVGLAMLVRGGAPRIPARRWLVTAGLALAVFAAAGWPARDAVTARTGLAPVVTATEQRSIDERLEQIRLGWRVVVERPVTGAGASALPIAMRGPEPDFPYLVLRAAPRRPGRGRRARDRRRAGLCLAGRGALAPARPASTSPARPSWRRRRRPWPRSRSSRSSTTTRGSVGRAGRSAGS